MRVIGYVCRIPKIQSITELVCQIADWVADSVLTKEDSRRRANTVKHLISIADVRMFVEVLSCGADFGFSGVGR